MSSLTFIEKLQKYPRAFFRTVFILINNAYCIPTYVIWMVMLLPLKRCNTDLYYRIEGIMFHWLLAVVSGWSWAAGYDIIEIGDDISQCKNHRTLVIANHQSTGDVPLLMASFNAKPDILPNIMWVMDRLFKFTNFGIVSLIHEDFFIASGKSNRDESLVALERHLINSYIPRKRNWVVLFPEGGFLRKRREVSQRFALKNNLPVLQHVTLPRVGALKTIINVLCTTSSRSNNNLKTLTNGNLNKQIDNDNYDGKENYLEYILDITIAYPDGIPLDLSTIVHGLRDPCQTYLFYRLYPCNEVPRDEETLTEWLYQRFVEKEVILDEFYKTGSFNHINGNTPTLLQQDVLRYIIIHLFFITSTYIHMQMIYQLYNYYNNMFLLSQTS